jgi:3-phosphoshikimate 1-carboxyvinyltransferase
MAALSDGISHIENPLDSLDSRSCAEACAVLGADITGQRENGVLRDWIVRGKRPVAEDGRAVSRTARHIDAGNSGTTLFFGLAAAALFSGPVTFTGDEQTARRGAGPLLDALKGLGVDVTSQNGCTPITIRGPWKGGKVSLSCPTSQYLSALLLAAPLAPAGVVTEIEVPLLNEKPYIDMTLAYLKAQGLCGQSPENPVCYEPDFSWFRVAGGAVYTPVNGPVPGDFSSAAFPAAAAVISASIPEKTPEGITLWGLDPDDTQGDKVFFEYLARMGCDVRWKRSVNRNDGETAEEKGGAWRLHVSRGGPLSGGVFDLNATPDMLPVLAALGAFASGGAGVTELVNAAHARIKETDRVSVMAQELDKLGIHCEEKPDGLVIHGITSRGRGGGRTIAVDGRGDHRVVMALACAALGMGGPVEIAGAEAADVTYPGFLELLRR